LASSLLSSREKETSGGGVYAGEEEAASESAGVEALFKSGRPPRPSLPGRARWDALTTSAAGNPAPVHV
jgi:hypothetical protein